MVVIRCEIHLIPKDTWQERQEGIELKHSKVNIYGCLIYKKFDHWSPRKSCFHKSVLKIGSLHFSTILLICQLFL